MTLYFFQVFPHLKKKGKGAFTTTYVFVNLGISKHFSIITSSTELVAWESAKELIPDASTVCNEFTILLYI